MSYLNGRVYDNGLSVLDTEATRLDICSSEPSTYVAATSTLTLGSKVGVSVGVPSAGVPNGRQVTVSGISDGSVSGTGNATHWALSDPANSRLLAAGALSSSQGVTSGNTFTLSSFTIRIPSPA